MRTIKFRQVKDGVTHYWGYIKGMGFVAPMATAEWHDVPSNQFTGLHDKNGKEIYEGDILESGSYGIVQVVWPEKYITGDNEDIMAWCVMGGNLEGLAGLDVQYSWEVIGNIYENPELLKEEQL